jgi:hypothetical protein
MIRVLIFSIAFLTLATTIATSQHREPITTRVERVVVDYCDAAEDLIFARFHVTAVFENHERRSLILLRHLDGPDAVSVRDSSGRKVLELDLGHQVFTKEDLVKIGELPDDRVFNIVKPGESAKRTISIQLPVSRDASGAAGTLVPGIYVIDATVVTEPPFSGDEAHIRNGLAHWNELGMFMVPHLRISGTRVHIQPDQKLPSCSSGSSGAGIGEARN